MNRTIAPGWPRFRRAAGIALLLGCLAVPLRAQFSPGDLSRAHQQLEGPNNCTQCHEVGKTISGQKCLACHTEIQQTIAGNHGYHSRVTAKQCIECHKEHVGREAQTYKFSPKTFRHAETGYDLAGKHRELDCAKCHTREQIRDKDVLTMLSGHPHMTYLGLRSACFSCHANPHDEQRKEQCSTCHTEEGWKNTRVFDHASTRYPLIGKHRAVACARCHTAAPADSPHRVGSFLIAEYSECGNCHKSPHTDKMAKQSCRSCHSEDGWNVAMKKTFNHDLTGFRLAGKHANIPCAKCHKPAEGATFSSTFLIRHRGCTDCHADYHLGEFAASNDNNCADCHTLEKFSPSLYTLALHNKGRFPLAGGHLAVPCQACHQKKGTKPARFHFADLRCETCHKSVHDIAVAAPSYAEGCKSCHGTESWQSVTFDHSTTKFPLKGKHASIACRECHKPVVKGDQRSFPFKGLRRECETCHRDSHKGQFETDGHTACGRCHSSGQWKELVFDHQRDSRFSLTGAHARVACGLCHKQETIGGSLAVRYKPLSNECESCHTNGRGT